MTMSNPQGPAAAAEAPPASEIPPDTEAPPTDPQPPTELALLFDRWTRSLRNLAHRWLTIAALEARLAALNVTLMLMIAVASGLLLASAWIALFAAIVAGLHALGLEWHSALLLVALVNLALAVSGLYYVNRLSKNLIFNTLRALAAAPEHDNADNLAGPAAGTTKAATPD